MMLAGLLICLPPGIEGLTTPTVFAADLMSRCAPAPMLLGSRDLMILCGCLVVLCLTSVRRKQQETI